MIKKRERDEIKKTRHMIFNYNIIKENIDIYNKIRDSLSVIKEYESGNVSIASMKYLGLQDFADFFNFLDSQKKMGFDLVMNDLSWIDLKNLLLSKANDGRLKTFMSNQSQNKFKLLLLNGEKYDKLLNGRWSSKPKYKRNGYLGFGRRDFNRLESLRSCFIPLLNWLIQNQIEVYDTKSDFLKSFVEQYEMQLKWYTRKIDCGKLPKREIEVSNKLLESFEVLVTESNIDFRKLNYNFILNSISDKLSKMMLIPKGTIIKSLVTTINSNSNNILTKDKMYIVEDSSIDKGFLKVMIIDDNNTRSFHSYSNFEDMSVHRNILLNNLLD